MMCSYAFYSKVVISRGVEEVDLINPRAISVKDSFGESPSARVSPSSTTKSTTGIRFQSLTTAVHRKELCCKDRLVALRFASEGAEVVA